MPRFSSSSRASGCRGFVRVARNSPGSLESVFTLGTPLARTDTIAKLAGRYQKFLPDGRRFLFTAYGAPENSGIYVGSLDGAPPERIRSDLSNAAYTPAGGSGRRRVSPISAERYAYSATLRFGSATDGWSPCRPAVTIV